MRGMPRDVDCEHTCPAKWIHDCVRSTGHIGPHRDWTNRTWTDADLKQDAVTFDARAAVHVAIQEADKRGACSLPACAFASMQRACSTVCNELTAALQSAYDAGRSAGRDEGLREAEEMAKRQDDGDSAAGRRTRSIAGAIARLRGLTPKVTP